MQPTWLIPPGSCAQSGAFGIPAASLFDSGFAFQGRLNFPMTTSSTKEPSLRALLHGQQNPATSLADPPGVERSRIARSNASTDLKIRKSNDSSFRFHI